MRIPAADLQRFVERALTAAGADAAEAPVIAAAIVWADLAGRATHGAWRLPTYVRRLRAGLVTSPCRPSIAAAADAVLAVDGHGGFGHYVGHVAMEQAIELARRRGVAVAAVTDSNHYGAGAYYVQMACERAMIGIALSNSLPRVAPFGGTERVFGTNPFAFGAPVRDGRSVLVDFSTGSSAGSMILKAAASGATIPTGVAVDGDGRPITDPARLAEGALLPFGGAKGYGIGLLVEVLCGVLTGAGISHEVASMFDNWERTGNNGHWFLALDVRALMPVETYFDRMDQLIGLIKGVRRMPGVSEVLLPGEHRWSRMAEQQADGIKVDEQMIGALASVADGLGIDRVCAA